MRPILALLLFLALADQPASGEPAAGQTQLAGMFRAPLPGDPGNAQTAFYLTFFPDGQVMRGAPDVGLAGYNAADQMNRDLRSGIAAKVWRWGVYKISGSQGRIDFADRTSVTLDLKNYPRAVETVGLNYVLLDSGDGLKLVGSYRSTKDDSFITFLPGGAMNQQGIVSNCISSGPHFSYGGRVPSMGSGGQLCLDRPLAGAYRVGVYTIQLVLPNSTPTFSFWADFIPGRTNPPALYINGTKFIPAG